MQVKNPLVSVIVPVYNVTSYLKRCLDSLLAQTLTNFELILVDDGSTDESPAICQTYQERDERIKVIRQANGGLSAARNRGLGIARGRYVAFVDSDDFVAPMYLERLYTSAERNHVDIAVCKLVKTDEAGAVIEKVPLAGDLTRSVISGPELLRRAYLPNGYPYIVAWNKLYRRSLFDQQKYQPDILHEDEEISARLFWPVERVALVEEFLYMYVQRSGSIMNSGKSRKQLLTMNQIYQERIRYYHSRDEDLFALTHQGYRAWIIRVFEREAGTLAKGDRRQLQHSFRESLKTIPGNRSGAARAQDAVGWVNIKLAGRLRNILGRD